jgi:hypothetical protein
VQALEGSLHQLATLLLIRIGGRRHLKHFLTEEGVIRFMIEVFDGSPSISCTASFLYILEMRTHLICSGVMNNSMSVISVYVQLGYHYGCSQNVCFFNDKTPAYDLEMSVLLDVRIGCTPSFRTWAVKTSARSEDPQYAAHVSLGLYGAIRAGGSEHDWVAARTWPMSNH